MDVQTGSPSKPNLHHFPVLYQTCIWYISPFNLGLHLSTRPARFPPWQQHRDPEQGWVSVINNPASSSPTSFKLMDHMWPFFFQLYPRTFQHRRGGCELAHDHKLAFICQLGQGSVTLHPSGQKSPSIICLGVTSWQTITFLLLKLL